MSDHEVEIALLKKELEQCNEKLDKITADVSELVKAWEAAGMLISVVKGAAALVLAISVIVGAWKFGLPKPD
jgi:hypothetical protein